MSFPKIGGSVGGRDHTTAMHSVRKIEQDVERDEMLRNDVQAIRERLQVS
jgi:chromosomal replication initiator protein